MKTMPSYITVIGWRVFLWQLSRLGLAAVCAFSMSTASAEESLKQGARRAGHVAGTVVHDIGEGAKKVGKEIGQGAKEAVKVVGEAAKEGGKEFRKAVKGEKP